MKVKVLLAILITGVCLSCNKEINENICMLNSASVAGTYKLVGMRYKASINAPEVDYLILREPCEQDDLVVFEANGTIKYNDVGVPCSPSGNLSSTWSLNGNNITIDGDPGIVESFDCSILVVSGKDLLTPGDAITFTYQKQ